MNIEHLKLFVRIAAKNNISMAGKELGLSPAVSSAHINKLEEGLGVRLIHRTTRRVSLTEEGIDFLPHAEEVIASVEIAKASVGSGSATPQGTLRITAPASFGRMHIVPALVSFTQRYPDLTLDLRLCDSILDMVEGGFDIAIRNSSLNDSTLVARKLSSDTRMLLASPDFIKRYGEPKSVDDLAEFNCVGLIGLEDWVFETPGGRRSIKPKCEVRMDNGEAVRDACVAGLGLTVSSAWCAYQHLQSGELVQILKDQPLTSDTAIWAVYPSSRLLAPKVRAVIVFLVERFGDKLYGEHSF
jgi:DNA-binding transcriptional LysR family regulator